MLYKRKKIKDVAQFTPENQEKCNILKWRKTIREIGMVIESEVVRFHKHCLKMFSLRYS